MYGWLCENYPMQCSWIFSQSKHDKWLRLGSFCTLASSHWFSYRLLFANIIYLLQTNKERLLNFNSNTYLTTRNNEGHLPGQRALLQVRDSTLAPMQLLVPPHLGVGWSQLRVLCWLPPAHTAEQVDHVVQGLHIPSTDTDKYKVIL